MKRALAERAKQQQSIPHPQQLHQQQQAPGTNSSSPELEQPLAPPQKIPRLTVSASAATTAAGTNAVKNKNSANKGSSTPVRSSTNASSASTGASSSAARNRRIQALTVAVGDQEIIDNASAFYLKHQNRALATELSSLQFAVQALEHERDFRRQQCLAACQALNSLQATWTQLETALSATATSSPTSAAATTSTSSLLLHQESTPPASTGAGANAVEWTRALAAALAALGNTNTTNSNSSSPTAAALSVEQLYADLSHLSNNVANRATVLQEHIWKSVLSSSQSPQEPKRPETLVFSSDAAAASNRLIELEHQVAELAASRDEVANRERKLRRNLYRLASGMLTTEQVVQTLEPQADDEHELDTVGSGNSNSSMVEAQVTREPQQQQAAANGAASVKQEEEGILGAATSRIAASATTATTNSALEIVSSSGTGIASRIQVERWQAQVSDLRNAVSSRQETIQDLNAKLKEKELQINQLWARQQSEQDAEKLKTFESTRLQLQFKEKTLEELQAKLDEARAEWSQSVGNEKQLQTTLDEQLIKFQKRWSEFTMSFQEEGGGGDNKNDGDAAGEAITTQEFSGEQVNAAAAASETSDSTPAPVPSLAEQVSQSKRIIELEHKLSQAMENVRRAESTRSDLAEALEMNQQLQSELDEIKTKYAALQASRSSSNSNAAASSSLSKQQQSSTTTTESSPAQQQQIDAGNNVTANKDVSSSTEPRPESSSSSGSSLKYEKMHRDYRRARKELAAMTISKDSAKAKLERSEKERESLMDANARLLRQSTEKDEMNAKSLATILHLKSLTEQLKSQLVNLEQQAKSASQLALAARLATNAKERVAEEATKYCKELEEKCTKLEQEHAYTKAQLAKIQHDWSEESGKLLALNTQLSNALQRSDDLVAEMQTKADEILKLRDTADKAERKARQALDELSTVVSKTNSNTDTAGASSSTGRVASAFTVDQLNTQISVLKGRLACPVCHYRDKECIIMRCRHMHCKQCVDERISNRSRKCPTCNNKFSEKDVEDVWLS